MRKSRVQLFSVVPVWWPGASDPCPLFKAILLPFCISDNSSVFEYDFKTNEHTIASSDCDFCADGAHSISNTCSDAVTDGQTNLAADQHAHASTNTCADTIADRSSQDNIDGPFE